MTPPPSITHEGQPAAAPSPLRRRKRLDSIAALELRYRQILLDNLAILRRRQLDEQRQQRLDKLSNLWPLWLGIVLAALAPQLEAIAKSYAPWGMNLLFPFVELANRPEIQFGSITHMLPSIMLFAQFPIEGLVAWCMLRRGIHPVRVTADVVLIHGFGIVDLWLLTAGASAILIR